MLPVTSGMSAVGSHCVALHSSIVLVGGYWEDVSGAFGALHITAQTVRPLVVN